MPRLAAGVGRSRVLYRRPEVLLNPVNAGKPAVFVRNQLVIAIPDGDPAGIAGLDDLTKPNVKVALCAAEVPCGTASAKALGHLRGQPQFVGSLRVVTAHPK